MAKPALKIEACYDAEAAELFDSVDSLPKAFLAASRAAGFEDANETLVFARQLETIKNRVYETQYPELKGRRFVPQSSEAGAEAENLTYRIWDDYVMAKVVGNYSTDIPLVTASAREVSVQPYVVADGYTCSVDDLRKAQAAGVPLVSRMAKAVRRGIELLRDEHTAFGVPEKGTFGLLNHPNVAVLSLPNGQWDDVATTGLEMLEDLNFLVTEMLTNTNEIFAGDTLLLSIPAFRRIATTLLNSANGSNITVLQAFRAQNDSSIAVESWTKLNTAAADGGPRMVFYKRDSEVLEFEIAIDFEQMPTEYHAMQYTTVCRAKWFGVQIQYPAAIMYVDNQDL